jgi:cobalamin 5'-phosphate synthase/cobalamin synthase
MTRFLAAVAFLTRVPIRRGFQSADVARAALFFPVVGAGIGFVQLVTLRLLKPHLPSLVVAVLVVALSAWVTRGLHLDGLADLADGLGGGATREEALRILRDPAVGAFGAVTIFLVLALKIAAVDALNAPAALVVAPALARWSTVPLGAFLPYARAGENAGLGSAMTRAGGVELAGATVLSAALSLLLPWPLVLGSWAAVLLVTLVVGAIARRRIGGMTGDVLGANVELAEASVLVAALC